MINDLLYVHGVGFLVRDIHAIAAHEPDSQHNLSHGQTVEWRSSRRHRLTSKRRDINPPRLAETSRDRTPATAPTDSMHQGLLNEPAVARSYDPQPTVAVPLEWDFGCTFV